MSDNWLPFFQTLNSKKILAIDTLPTIVENMACYLDCLPLESGLGTVMPLWNTLLSQLEILFRRMVFFLNNFDDLVPLLRIMISILKIPCINQFKVGVFITHSVSPLLTLHKNFFILTGYAGSIFKNTQSRNTESAIGVLLR